MEIGDKVKMANPGWADVTEQPVEITGTIVGFSGDSLYPQVLFLPDNAELSTEPIQFAASMLEPYNG